VPLTEIPDSEIMFHRLMSR